MSVATNLKDFLKSRSGVTLCFFIAFFVSIDVNSVFPRGLRLHWGQAGHHGCFFFPLCRCIYYITASFQSADFCVLCVFFPAGVCDDRRVWSRVHYQDMERWLLLPLPGLAGTPALCQETVLCHRYVVCVSVCAYFRLDIFLAASLFSYASIWH